MLKKILLLGVLVFFAFALTTCGGSADPGESWTYVGTWVNPDYNGMSGGPPAKLVFGASSVAYYENDTDTIPLGTGSTTMADDWTSGGNHYFKGTSTDGFTTNYFLLRVSGNNNTLELNATTTDYPATIDPGGPQYCIFTRQ